MSSNPVATGELIRGSAANADNLGDAMTAQSHSDTHVVDPNIEATGGWDAYEVWRRFIKDARDRRKPQESKPS
jgi:hypothetical protein